MPRSEIDDIFAAKKSTAKVMAQSVASTSTSTDAAGSKKKKKDKKRKRQAEEAPDSGGTGEKPKKKRVVETVHDPSATASSVSSSKKAVKPGNGTGVTKPKTAKKEKEDLGRFKDSRGIGPRKCGPSRDMHCGLTEHQAAKLRRASQSLKRRSWGLIQKPEVPSAQCFPRPGTDPCSGTPLCPFDCDCCESTIYPSGFRGN